MRDGMSLKLWVPILGVAALLLAGPVGAGAGVDLDGESAPPSWQESGRAAGEMDGGGCPGCCARGAAGKGASCRRAGRGGGCCGMGGGMGRRGGHGPGMRPGRGAGHGGPPAVIQTARELVHRYRGAIERQVEMLDNGVVTVTRAPESPEAAAAIRRHVREMKELLGSGGRVRMWDPLFRELFDRADEISMELEELEDGMRVRETSDDPEVVRLIQAHARKVDAFLARGPAAVHEESPLPEGYGAGE